MSKNIDWISAAKELPKEEGTYLVYVHAPESPQKAGASSVESYIECYFYSKRQNIWKNESRGAYNAIVSFVDVDGDYYVSHWAELPDAPDGGKEG